MNIIHERVGKKNFKDGIDKVKNRLAGWKARQLSLAGRITLQQSVLSAIPSYTMQTMRMPLSVCEELDRQSRAGGMKSERERCT